MRTSTNLYPNPMTTILYLITEFDTGGAENMLFELASRLDRQKFKVHACCLTGRGPVGEKLSAAGVSVRYLDMKGKADFAAFLRLIKIIKNIKPGILHTFLFHANFIGRIAGKCARVPVIISSVRVSEKEQILHLLGERITHPLADVILCVSGAVKKFMAGNGIPETKMRVVPNGVDLRKCALKYDEKEVKRELNIPVNAKVAGTISRLTAQKRIDRFLDCASLVLKKLPDCFFVVVGRGELEGELKDYAKRKGISERVRFTGFRADALRVMSSFDVFMLTSSWEGMPVALLEAMASGKPVIASAVEGSSEVVRDGESGLLVEADDIEGYASRAVELLKSSDYALKIANSARNRAKDYSVDEMVRKNSDLYVKLLP